MPVADTTRPGRQRPVAKRKRRPAPAQTGGLGRGALNEALAALQGSVGSPSSAGDTKGAADRARGERQRRSDAAATRRRQAGVKDTKGASDLGRAREYHVTHPFEPGVSEADLQEAQRRGLVKLGPKVDNAARSRKRAALLAPALSILGEVARPGHAIAGAVSEGVHHGLGAVPRGLYEGGVKNKPYAFGPLLKEAGLPKGAAAALGFVADVGTDPTTYLSFGTASVARKSAEAAARAATRKALKAGASKSAADRAGRAAAGRALKAKANRGVTVGVGSARTSGRGSAAVLRATKLDKAGGRVRDKASGALRHVNPNYRPPGVSDAEWARIRNAVRRGRAMATAGERQARNHAIALHKALGGGESHPRITDALEALGAPRFSEKTVHAGMGPEAAKARERFIKAQEAEGAARREVAAEAAHVREGQAMRRSWLAAGKPVPAAFERRLVDATDRLRKKQAREMEATAARTVAGRDMDRVIAREPPIQETVKVPVPREQVRADVFAGLSAPEQKAAVFLAREYDRMHAAENAHGLVGAKFKEFGYSPRRHIGELDPTSAKRFAQRGADMASSKARTNRKLYRDFRGTEHDLYTENAPLAYYLRGRDSALKLGRKHVLDELLRSGRKVTPKAPIRDGEGVYLFRPRKPPEEITGRDLEALLQGGEKYGAVAKQGRLVVLNRELVRAADHGAPQRLDELDAISRLWDRSIQGRVKTILTVPNPQYHLTNLYGDLFNAYLGSNVARVAKNLGVSTAALTFKARREAAARTLDKQIDPSGKGVVVLRRHAGSVKVGKERMTYAELIKEAEDVGAIGGGFIGRDLPEVLVSQGKQVRERLGKGAVARKLGKAGEKVAGSRVGSKLGHPIDAIRDVSQYREDAVRLATYLGARKRGLSPDDASAFVQRQHFDYGDLSQFEKSVLRRVMPFYTFTARNTPLQAKTLLSRPGKYANVEKARAEAAYAAGLDPGYEGQLRDYEQRGVPIPIPGVNVGGNPALLFPKLPLMDLNRLSPKGQGDALIAMLTPVLKVPLELTANYNFFFKSKIDELLDHPGPHGERVETLKPAPKWLAHLPGPIRDALRLQPYHDKNGQALLGWPAKLDYLLKQTPLSGTALQFGTDTENARGQNAALRVIGYGTGLKVAPLDKTKRAEDRKFDERAYLEAVATSMRKTGRARTANGATTPEYQRVLDRKRKLEGELGITGKKGTSRGGGGSGWGSSSPSSSSGSGGGWGAAGGGKSAGAAPGGAPAAAAGGWGSAAGG